MGRNVKSRILIAEDHPVVCQALARLINRQEGMTCCGTLNDAASVVPGVREHLPDLLLLDLCFNDGDGISLIKAIMRHDPNMRVLVISQLDDRKHVEESLKAGARGYLTKKAQTKEILTAIRTILRGSDYAKKLKVDGSSMPGKLRPVFPTSRDGQSVKLTKRENEVLHLIGAGKRVKDIAMQLNLSHKTIETYPENLKQKLSFANSAELVHFAICYCERQSNLSSGSRSI